MVFKRLDHGAHAASVMSTASRIPLIADKTTSWARGRDRVTA